MDYVYRHVDYHSPGFRRFTARQPGDGGIIPGGLVFTEDLALFSGRSITEILREILGTAEPDTVNLGGPAIIALINAAQLLHGQDIMCHFQACIGNDQAGAAIRDFIAATPVQAVFTSAPRTASPSTVVLADPAANDGNGERSFLNTIGAAGVIHPDDLPTDFFFSDIVLFGGTALTPRLHDGLATLLRRAKSAGAITVVGTVYDFRNEKRNPDRAWPLGSPDACQDIDILVTDAVEAIRLTKASDLPGAARNFIDRGVGALVITNGEQGMLAWSGGRIFGHLPLGAYPVSAAVRTRLVGHPELFADTTGCGDNFLGGIVASLAMQIKRGCASVPDLTEALAWGAASGGFACFHAGGLYQEHQAGEKLAKVDPLARRYAEQLTQKGGGT
jgi:sugar/nucleoside kinase (ribokinase family)